MKICTKHQTEKIQQGDRWRCRTCNIEHSKKWYSLKENKVTHIARVAKNKIKRGEEIKTSIIEYLSSHPCVDCEENDIIVLEFDHVRGKKLYNISDMVARDFSWKSIQKEIEKCDIRCANCHKRRTAQMFSYYKT